MPDRASLGNIVSMFLSTPSVWMVMAEWPKWVCALDYLGDARTEEEAKRRT